MAKSKKPQVEIAKPGSTIVVVIDGDAPKTKGARYEVKSIITCHKRKFYRLVDDKGKPFHLSPSSAKVAK